MIVRTVEVIWLIPFATVLFCVYSAMPVECCVCCYVWKKDFLQCLQLPCELLYLLCFIASWT